MSIGKTRCSRISSAMSEMGPPAGKCLQEVLANASITFESDRLNARFGFVARSVEILVVPQFVCPRPLLSRARKGLETDWSAGPEGQVWISACTEQPCLQRVTTILGHLESDPSFEARCFENSQHILFDLRGFKLGFE